MLAVVFQHCELNLNRHVERGYDTTDNLKESCVFSWAVNQGASLQQFMGFLGLHDGKETDHGFRILLSPPVPRGILS